VFLDIDTNDISVVDPVALGESVLAFFELPASLLWPRFLVISQ